MDDLMGMNEPIEFDKISRGRVQSAPPQPDYTGLAISQELMAAADRAIGLRIELLKRDARIVDLEREVAELKRENV